MMEEQKQTKEEMLLKIRKHLKEEMLMEVRKYLDELEQASGQKVQKIKTKLARDGKREYPNASTTLLYLQVIRQMVDDSIEYYKEATL